MFARVRSMFLVFLPFICLASCSTGVDPDQVGSAESYPVNRDALSLKRAPARIQDRARNLPGFIDPSLAELTSPVNGLKIDKRDNIEFGTPSYLIGSVYLSQGKINVSKIQEKIDLTKFLGDKARTIPGVSKKVAKALTIAKRVLEQAKKTAESINSNSSLDLKRTADLNGSEMQSFYEDLFQGLEMIDVARSEDPDYGKHWRFKLASLNYLKKFTVENRLEAMNLNVPPETRRQLGLSEAQAFFHPDQLKGIDISKLDPVESGMWKKQESISTFDTSRYDLAPDVSDYEILTSQDQIISVAFDEYPDSGFSPKMDVRLALEQGGKIKEKKFKMKLWTRAPLASSATTLPTTLIHFLRNFREVNTETVVNNLAAAIGYQIAPTFYKKEVRLFLDEDTHNVIKGQNSQLSRSSVKALLQARFKKARDEFVDRLMRDGAQRTMMEVPWDYASALPFDESNFDETAQRFYIPVKNVSLEEKGETKFGFAIKSNFGRAFKREFRAFSLFLAWVSDDDASDHNSDVRYDYDEASGKLVLKYVAADMGSSFGFFQGKDAPRTFNPNILTPDSSAQKLNLTFRTRHFSPIFGTVSINDAKWFTRKLAQLTSDQIQAALVAGGYDVCSVDVLKTKLMRRRDQLVSSLGLTKEYPLFKSSNADLRSTFVYQPPVGCQKFYKGDVLIATEAGAQSELQADSRTLSDENSSKHDFANALKTNLFAIGARQLGGTMQRYTYRDGEGFFDGIVKYTGAQVQLLPARFIMPNPFRNPYDANSPQFWVVGVSRIAIGAGYARRIPNQNATFRNLQTISSDVSAMWIRERVEVQPVSTVEAASAITHYYQVLDPRNIGAAFEGIHSETVESLRENSSLVINSTYKMTGASIRSTASLLASGPFASVGVDSTLMNRSAVLRESSDNFLVVRSAGKGFAIKSEAGANILFFTFPLFTFKSEKESEKQVIYRVPISTSGYGDIIKGVLGEDSQELAKSDNQFAKFLATDRQLNTSGSFLSLQSLGFTNWYSQNKRSILTQASAKGSQSVIETLDLRARGSGKAHGWFANEHLIRDEYSASGLIVNGQTAKTVMTWTYKRESANRNDLIKYADRVVPVFPLGLSQEDYRDPRLVNNNVVTLAFNGFVAIGEAGWKKILSRSVATPDERKVLCETWMSTLDLKRIFGWDAKSQSFENEEDAAIVRGLCNKLEKFVMGGPNADREHQAIVQSAFQKEKVSKLMWSLKLFIVRFAKAAALYKQNAAGQMNVKLRDAMVDLIYIKEHTEFVVRALKSMIGDEDYYQYAKLESSGKGGLILQSSLIEVPEDERGALSGVDEIRRPSLLLQDFAQKAFDALEEYHVFYDYFFLERIGNRVLLKELMEVTQQFPH